MIIGKYRPVSEPLPFLAERTLIGDGCWLWTGSLNAKGYGVGRLGHGTKAFLAHRLSYRVLNSPIPEGMHVLHRCDNPRCIRPDHLFLGSNLDNIKDRMAKGRPGSQAWAGSGERHPNAKLSDRDVSTIKALRAEGTRCIDLAATYGVTPRHISAICIGIARSR